MKSKKSKILFNSLLTTSLSIGILFPTTSCVSANADQNIVTVTFKQPVGVIVTGQKIFKVRKGERLSTISKPKAQKNISKYIGWVIEGKEGLGIVPEDYIIQENISLIPKFDVIELTNTVGINIIEDTKISLSKTGPWSGPDLWYSSEFGENWHQMEVDKPVSFPAGKTIYLRGNNIDGFSLDANNYATIEFSNASAKVASSVNIFGSCLGLLDEAHGTLQLPESGDYCFYKLFEGQTEIKYVSDTFIPSVTLKPHCYDSMFKDCSKLKKVPVIPNFKTQTNATDLDGSCKEIFSGCEQLKEIRLWYKGNFDEGDANDKCWANWAFGSNKEEKLVYDGNKEDVPGMPDDWTKDNVLKIPDSIDVTQVDGLTSGSSDHPYQFKAVCKKNNSSDHVYQNVMWWVDDKSVATINSATGVLIGDWTTAEQDLHGDGKVNIVAVSSMTNKDIAPIEGRFENFGMKALNDTNYVKITSNSQTGSTFSWHYEGPGNVPNIKYSYDGNIWKTLDTQQIITMVNGQVIYLKGNNPNGLNNGTENSYTKFEIPSGSNISISGNAMGLLDDGTGTITNFDITKDNFKYCFYRMFDNCDGLTSVSDNFLPAKNAPEGVYKNMFRNCHYLEKIPNLPAETISSHCYENMFQFCSSLVNPQATLPANTLADYCYKGMFYQCLNLTTTPTLPAKVAKNSCYYWMFQNCLSLKTIKSIGLTSLANYCCLQMFALSDVTSYASICIRSEKTFESSSYLNYFFKCPNMGSYTSPTFNMLQNFYKYRGEWYVENCNITQGNYYAYS